MSISVIIPNYNGKEFLRPAVESVLSQDVENLEVIVVDDASTDHSLDSIRDLNVKVIQNTKNLGIAPTMNVGIKVAKNPWVAFLDSDDLMAPHSLAWRLNYVTKNGGIGVAGAPAGIIDEKGNGLPQLKHVFTPGYHPPKVLSLDELKKGALYPLLTWLFLIRKSAIEEAGFLDESLTSAFDCDLFLKILTKHKIPVELKPTVFRRWHKGNHSLDEVAGRKALKKRTIDEVIAVCKRYGIIASGEFFLWESGYQPQG